MTDPQPADREGVVTLTEFLLARITEDEEEARSACASVEGRGEHWESKSGTYADHVRRVGPHLRDRQIAEATFGARHIARHDPARVLAECEAKRRIVALHQREFSLTPEAQDADRRCSLEPVVRILAEPYADHPDFRQEWRP